MAKQNRGPSGSQHSGQDGLPRRAYKLSHAHNPKLTSFTASAGDPGQLHCWALLSPMIFLTDSRVAAHSPCGRNRKLTSDTHSAPTLPAPASLALPPCLPASLPAPRGSRAFPDSPSLQPSAPSLQWPAGPHQVTGGLLAPGPHLPPQPPRHTSPFHRQWRALLQGFHTTHTVGPSGSRGWDQYLHCHSNGSPSSKQPGCPPRT